MGFGVVLGSLRRSRRARAWLLASGVFVPVVGAIQQYSVPSNTRLFILLPINAVFAGLGGAALGRLLLRGSIIGQWIYVFLLVAFACAWNQLHIERISLPAFRPNTETLVIEQLQETETTDRGGMPVFIVMSRGHRLTISWIAGAYGVGRERLVLIDPEEAMILPQLCSAATQPAIALLDPRAGDVDKVRQRIAACWPGHDEAALGGSGGHPLLHRFFTASGTEEALRPRRLRRGNRLHPETLFVPEPGDVVSGRDSTLFVLSRARRSVYAFSSDRRSWWHFPVAQDSPSAMILAGDAALVIAGTGGTSRLVSYDTQGNPLRLAPMPFLSATPRGLAVRSDGEIVASDPVTGKLLLLSYGGVRLGELSGNGRVRAPSSVAPVADGSLWVLNAGRELLHLSLQDDVLGAMSVPATDLDRSSRFTVAPDGDLVLAEPDAGRVVRRDAGGRLVHVWSGFQRPMGLTLDPAGHLIVCDWAVDEVAVLPPILPSERVPSE